MGDERSAFSGVNTHLASSVRDQASIRSRGGNEDGRGKCCGCWSVAVTPGGGPSLATKLLRLRSGFDK